MFKCLPVALLGVAIFSGSSLEAQLFRRFVAPRPVAPQPAAPVYRTAPAQASNAGPVAAPQRSYFRRVQVTPGRFALVPVQPNGAALQGQRVVAPQSLTVSPQDIARQAALQAAQQAAQQGSTQQTITVTLDGPQLNRPQPTAPQGSSIVVRRPQPVQPTPTIRPAPVPQPTSVATRTVQQSPQRYRPVTVYNTRTGQRSTRLIPIPSSTLTQQPYVYGQNQFSQPAAVPQVVTGRLAPPTQVASPVASRVVNPVFNPVGNPVANPVANAVGQSNEIRLDSQVQPVSLDGSAVVLEQPSLVTPPQAASAIPATPSVNPEPQPAISTAALAQPAIATTDLAQTDNPSSGLAEDTEGQFSVLVSDDEAGDDSSADIQLELDAPAN